MGLVLAWGGYAAGLGLICGDYAANSDEVGGGCEGYWRARIRTSLAESSSPRDSGEGDALVIMDGALGTSSATPSARKRRETVNGLS